MQPFLCLSPNREQLGTNTRMILHVRAELRVSESLSQMKSSVAVGDGCGVHGCNKLTCNNMDSVSGKCLRRSTVLNFDVASPANW
jgi:hypothetical protein